MLLSAVAAVHNPLSTHCLNLHLALMSLSPCQPKCISGRHPSPVLEIRPSFHPGPLALITPSPCRPKWIPGRHPSPVLGFHSSFHPVSLPASSDAENSVPASAAAVATVIRRASPSSPVKFTQRVEKQGNGGLVLPSPDFQRLCLEQLDLFRMVVDSDAILSDVAQKIMSFVQQLEHTFCSLAASGAISRASLLHPAVFGGCVTYEGRFEILSLSGSFVHNRTDGDSRSGGLSICLSGADGRVVGGWC